MNALSGLAILDLSQRLAGAYAAALFVRLGAAVLRVEREPCRALQLDGPLRSFLDLGKTIVPASSQVFDAERHIGRLSVRHDIVIEDATAIGDPPWDWPPQTIRCRITPYGLTGPDAGRAAEDCNVLARAGIMSHSGLAADGPVPQGPSIAELGPGAQHAVLAILGAVIHRQTTGRGQTIDVAMHDGALLWNAYAASYSLVGGEPATYESTRLNGGSHYGYYATADGRYLSVGSLEDKFWKGLCAALGREDLIARLGAPGAAMAPVRQALRAAFAEKTLAEWETLFGALDVCVEPVLTVGEVMKHPQARARGLASDGPAPAFVGAPVPVGGYSCGPARFLDDEGVNALLRDML